MKNKTDSDERLRELLRSARAEPTLPAGFIPSVWSRIERNELRAENVGWVEWLNRLVERLLAPRVAIAGLAAVLLIGSVAGGVHAAGDVRQAAQQRYLTAVAPFQP